MGCTVPSDNIPGWMTGCMDGVLVLLTPRCVWANAWMSVPCVLSSCIQHINSEYTCVQTSTLAIPSQPRFTKTNRRSPRLSQASNLPTKSITPYWASAHPAQQRSICSRTPQTDKWPYSPRHQKCSSSRFFYFFIFPFSFFKKIFFFFIISLLKEIGKRKGKEK
jgi:hypothetical protein